MKPDVFNWLKGNCNRLVFGKCTTLSCLKRGGYTGPPASPDITTCIPFEIFNELKNKEKENQIDRTTAS